jgi:hypothetical protein
MIFGASMEGSIGCCADAAEVNRMEMRVMGKRFFMG